MKKETAKQINQVMLEHSQELDESVRLVLETCTTEEFEAYRDAVGQIMGTMLLDIMNPIYLEHPELKPSDLD
jgi:hypothetical protein